MKKFVCSICGYVHDAEVAPSPCPQCGASAEKFSEKVEGETKVDEQNREALFNMEKIVRILKANISSRN